jgi:hypothetical protein
MSEADAIDEGTAATAADDAAKVRATLNDAGPQAMRTASRLTYVTSYMISYSIVYAAVFVAHSLPQNNALMHGLYDGGVAARYTLRGRYD